MTQEDINALEIKHIRELIEVQAIANDKALKLQTNELARRLDILNGEAERLKQMQMHYVSKESYEIQHRIVCLDIEDLKKYKNNQQGKSAVWSVIVPALISLGIGLLMWKLTEI